MADTLTSILSIASISGCIQNIGSFSWLNDMVSLHYADDTLLLMPRDLKSLIFFKLLLHEFEMMMGLKINFHKSFVYNLSRCEEVDTRAATVLNCNLGSLPFTYLELPIKANFLTREDWQPLIKRAENRLATWKGMHFLEEVGSFLWTPHCHPCHYTSCPSTIFRKG